MTFGCSFDVNRHHIAAMNDNCESVGGVFTVDVDRKSAWAYSLITDCIFPPSVKSEASE